MTYPQQSKQWYTESNYIIQLTCKNEDELKCYIDRAHKKQIKCVIFREPDLNNEITAICLEPSLNALKLIGSLPLMLKNEENLDSNNRSSSA